MNRMIGMIAVLALVTGVCWAQDETQALDKPADLVRESLLKAIEKGGIVLKGNYESDRDPMVMIGGMQGSIEGDFTARIGANGVSCVTVENKDGRIEIYRKSGRTVTRQTWAGSTQPSVGDFARETARLVSLKTIKSYLRNAKDFEEAGEKEIDGRTCRVVKTKFPAGLLEDDEDEEENEFGVPMKFKMLEVKGVKARFFVDKEDGTLRKFKVEVEKGFSAAVRMGGPGGHEDWDEDDGDEDEGDEGDKKEGDEEEEDNVPGMPGFDMKFGGTYTFEVSEVSESLKVEVPAEIEKFFEE